jgi:acyl carrier protein
MMSVSYDEAEQFVRDEVAALTGEAPEKVTAGTVLVGTGRVVDSADLVMLLLAVEDFARERGSYFDWTSDSAMSEARSILRSIGTLARHVSELPPSA